MKTLKFEINGEAVHLDLAAARKGRIRIVRGHLEQCDGCGDDQAYGLLAPAGGDITLACNCGETYSGSLSSS